MTSLQGKLLRLVLTTWARNQFDTQAPVDQQRVAVERFAGRSTVPRSIQIEPVEIGSMQAEWLRVPNEKQGGVLLYLHGGAYYLGSIRTARPLAARIALEAGIDALLIDYRLAPERTFPAALLDTQMAYCWLLDRGFSPEQIAFAGESAGGGLVLAAMMALRDAQETLPAAGVCLSPWVDLANTGESYQTRVDVDPWGTTRADHDRSAKMYAGDYDTHNPLISPLYGDLHGLPPLLIQVGDHEVLLSDATRIAERARDAGVEITVHVWEGMWHVFQSLGGMMPESRHAIREIGEFIRDRLDR